MEVNEALNKIKNEFYENKNSHIFLIETNDIEKAIASIKEVIKEKIGSNDPLIAHQIEDEVYLELMILRSDGKTIKNDRVAELQDRLKMKPILSDYMFYIIASAEDLNESASNKLLKTIEEPNPNVVGFLIAKNTDLLLPTIKSRCEKITLIYEEMEHTEIPKETETFTKDLVKAIELKDHTTFYKLKITNKTLKEDALIIENLIKDYYNMACNLKDAKESDSELIEFIKTNNDNITLIKKAKYMNETLTKTIKNMNADLLLEKIFFDLKEVK